MKEADLLSINQITLASEYVDSDLEWAIRTFHQESISIAPSRFESLFSVSPINVSTLHQFEFIETRFSHLTETIDLGEKLSSSVKRWESLTQGDPLFSVDKSLISPLFQKAFGADVSKRRPYPSGGALYTVEPILITGSKVTGLRALSALHYLSVSNAFEVLRENINPHDYEKLTDIKGVAFYILYCINLKKSIVKYRNRGYRLSLLEVGSMYQNALQEAQILGLSSRVISGFLEGYIGQLCHFDSGLMLPTILQAFGVERETNDQTL